MGGDRFDCGQDRLHGGDPARPGAAGRARPGAQTGADKRRSGPSRYGPASGHQAGPGGELSGMRSAQGLAAIAARGDRHAALPSGTADEAHGPGGCCAGPHGQNHDQQSGGALPGGSGEPAIPGAGAHVLWVSDFTYIATWQGFAYVAFVIDVFAKRIVGAHRRLARVALGARGLRAGCIGTGLERPAAGAARWIGASQRPWRAICQHSLHRAPDGSRHRTLCRSRRRQLRQCARRNHQRPVQDRTDPPPRSLAQRRDRGTCDPRMGRLVQQSPPARTDRKYPPAEAEARYYAQVSEHAMAA